MLLGGVPGVPSAKVVILGGGGGRTNAARMAMGMEAHVMVLDVSLHRLYELDLQSARSCTPCSPPSMPSRNMWSPPTS